MSTCSSSKSARSPQMMVLGCAGNLTTFRGVNLTSPISGTRTRVPVALSRVPCRSWPHHKRCRTPLRSAPTIRDNVTSAHDCAWYRKSFPSRPAKASRVKQLTFHEDLTWWEKKGALPVYVPATARLHLLSVPHGSITAANERAKKTLKAICRKKERHGMEKGGTNYSSWAAAR